MYVAKIDTPLLNLLLQRGPVIVETFCINEFHFLLLDIEPFMNILYTLTMLQRANSVFCYLFSA